MEVRLTPELQAKLNEAVKETGRKGRGLVHDAMIGYLQDLTQARSTLDQRYDDIKNGKAVSIDGEEVFARLRRKSERRSAPS